MLDYRHGQRRRRSRKEPTVPLRGHSTYRGAIPQLGRRHQRTRGLGVVDDGGRAQQGIERLMWRQQPLLGPRVLPSGRIVFGMKRKGSVPAREEKPIGEVRGRSTHRAPVQSLDGAPQDSSGVRREVGRTVRVYTSSKRTPGTTRRTSDQELGAPLTVEQETKDRPGQFTSCRPPPQPKLLPHGDTRELEVLSIRPDRGGRAVMRTARTPLRHSIVDPDTEP